MASQSANPGRDRNQNGALCTAVTSICGTPDRHYSQGVLGPHIVLDARRSRKQAARVPELLQQASHAYFTGGTNAGSGHERVAAARRSPLLPVATPLPGSLSDTDSCLTSQRPSLAIASNGLIEAISWNASVPRFVEGRY